ncbi:hypothetical protein E2C01_072320 [Portunus trituberculatus]|uniref:Uncharacterized protein n=1 Tax=Portunus trituberculatus TaxID=210409 RepID=A0A5B7HXN2_PORTR|nr:hypothetical protein [Portunus trituberculatus]
MAPTPTASQHTPPPRQCCCPAARVPRFTPVTLASQYFLVSLQNLYHYFPGNIHGLTFMKAIQ